MSNHWWKMVQNQANTNRIQYELPRCACSSRRPEIRRDPRGRALCQPWDGVNPYRAARRAKKLRVARKAKGGTAEDAEAGRARDEERERDEAKNKEHDETAERERESEK